MADKELTFNEMAKIADKSSCVLLSKEEWSAFTKKLFSLDEENKRLKKINDKLRNNIAG